MEVGSPNMFATRLKLARKKAGMSLQELSDALENVVSKQALNKYEMGEMNPTSEVLLAISKTLKVKPDFFLKQNQLELGEILFRKRVSLAKKIEDSIVEKVREHIDNWLEIENILGIENDFKNPLKNFKIKDKSDVEKAAEKLRAVWELGNNTIPNIVEVLELKGVKVFLVEEADEFDGLATFTSSGIPIVVVNTKDRSIERIRFTIVHELAHLLLQFNDLVKGDGKLIEVLCHRFSSSFLIPSSMLLKLIGGPKRSYIAINELISIKESNGISLRALVYALKELEVITESYYQRWVIYMSKQFGSKNEPGHYQGREKSRLFEQLVSRAISEELISISKAAALCNTSISEIRKKLDGVE